MEKIIYNTRTKEISKDDISTKAVTSTIKGKVVTGYNGWKNAVLYSKDELKILGKPKHYSVPIFVEIDDNTVEQIANGFYEKSTQQEIQAEKQQPWFGKVIPLVGKDGSQFRILDLETGNIVHEKENSGSIYLIDKDYYEIFDQDWSAFDVIGAFDESVHYLKRDGITIFKSYQNIHPQYKDGKLEGVKVGGTFISKEELDNNYNKKVAALNVRKALEAAKEAGLKLEDISKDVNMILGSKQGELNF